VEECDILIVGGGPAGSSLAWGLRKTDLNVLIVDKKSFPRDKTCAGWITPAIIDSLQLDLDDYQQDHTLQPINGFQIGFIDGQSVQIDYDTPVSYGIRRCELDHYLLKRTNARFKSGINVNNLIRESDCWLVNDQIRAQLIIGAGGNFCPVARHIGAKPGKQEISVRAQEIEFKMNASQAQSCPASPSRPELYFCKDLKGYGWVFRKGDFLNIGLGREDESGLPRHMQDFIEYLKKNGRIPTDIPEKLHGHAYLLYDHANRKVYDDRLLLIGDSAGLAYTQSGEGIRPAIESGLMAAHTILNAKGNYTTGQLRHYQTQLESRFGQRKGENSIIDRLIPDSVKQWLAGRLLPSSWFAKTVVIDKWFLHQHQDRLELPGDAA